MSLVIDIDDILLDRYEVFGFESGGMGVVYFLTDLTTGRDYAAKTIRYDPVRRDEIAKRFRSEIEFSLELGPHPNLLNVHFIEEINHQFFLFSDYIDGGIRGKSLRERIDNAEIDRPTAISFAYQIAAGMAFLNERGDVVHLDLKPENILVTADDVVKIADFGLARHNDLFRDAPLRERAGSHLYKSPEQLKGEFVDTRSDIYSFGLIFYEMLMGRLPFNFSTSGKSGEETVALLRQFYDTNDLGEEFYWRGLPTGTHGGDSDSRWGGDIGVLIGGCIAVKKDKRIYNFRMVRDGMAYSFGSCITAQRQNDIQSRDHFQTGLDRQKLSQHSQALQCFNKVLKRNPGNIQARVAAADSLWATGNHKQAVQFLKDALEHQPDNQFIRHKLKKYRTKITEG